MNRVWLRLGLWAILALGVSACGGEAEPPASAAEGPAASGGSIESSSAVSESNTLGSTDGADSSAGSDSGAAPSSGETYAGKPVFGSDYPQALMTWYSLRKGPPDWERLAARGDAVQAANEFDRADALQEAVEQLKATFSAFETDGYLGVETQVNAELLEYDSAAKGFPLHFTEDRPYILPLLLRYQDVLPGAFALTDSLSVALMNLDEITHLPASSEEGRALLEESGNVRTFDVRMILQPIAADSLEGVKVLRCYARRLDLQHEGTTLAQIEVEPLPADVVRALRDDANRLTIDSMRPGLLPLAMYFARTNNEPDFAAAAAWQKTNRRPPGSERGDYEQQLLQYFRREMVDPGDTAIRVVGEAGNSWYRRPSGGLMIGAFEGRATMLSNEFSGFGFYYIDLIFDNKPENAVFPMSEEQAKETLGRTGWLGWEILGTFKGFEAGPTPVMNVHIDELRLYRDRFQTDLAYTRIFDR